jgi:hypothetical protein
MSITQSLLSQIEKADDGRVLRAIEALRSGAMAVKILYNGGVLTAEIVSTSVVGKKKPVEKVETYAVLLAPTHYECTCKDHMYRGAICKHLLVAVMAEQEAGQEQVV